MTSRYTFRRHGALLAIALIGLAAACAGFVSDLGAWMGPVAFASGWLLGMAMGLNQRIIYDADEALKELGARPRK